MILLDSQGVHCALIRSDHSFWSTKNTSVGSIDSLWIHFGVGLSRKVMMMVTGDGYHENLFAGAGFVDWVPEGKGAGWQGVGWKGRERAGGGEGGESS